MQIAGSAQRPSVTLPQLLCRQWQSEIVLALGREIAVDVFELQIASCIGWFRSCLGSGKVTLVRHE